MKLEIFLDAGAKAPTKAYDFDAGLDLYAYKFGATSGLIDTGVHVLLPAGYMGLVLPRSSINARGIVCATGVIDAGYTGSIKVTLWDYNLICNNSFSTSDANRDGNSMWVNTSTLLNIGKKRGLDLDVKPGDRVAQLVILPIPSIELVKLDVDAWRAKQGLSLRGEKGFGSSGR